MHVLLIDTSIQGLALALLELEQGRAVVLESVWHPKPQDAASALPHLVGELLGGRQLSLADILALGIGVGPGSFTGIKIGLSFAYGVKRGFPQIGLFGISVLRGLARVGDVASGTVWVLPATRNAGYFVFKDVDVPVLGTLVVDKGQWELKIADTLSTSLSVERVAGMNVLGSIEALSVCEQGPFASLNVAYLERATLETTIFAGMLSECSENWKNAGDILPNPLYLRRSAPEEKLMTQAGR